MFYIDYVVDPPRVTTHPKDLKYVVPGKTLMFTAEAIGTEPLSYHWQWNPAGKGGGKEVWQSCDIAGSGGDSSKLIISSVQKPDEGSYRCVISNYAGSQISKSAQLSVGKNSNFYVHVKKY